MLKFYNPYQTFFCYMDFIRTLLNSRTVAALFLLVCQVSYSADEPIYCNKKPIRIAWSPYIPYSYKPNAESEVKGKDIEFAKDIFSVVRCSFVFMETPWEEAIIDMMRNGGVDVMLYASRVKERELFANFSIPYRAESVRIAILKKNQFKWHLKKLTDIGYYQIRLAHSEKAWSGPELNDLLNSSYKHWFKNVAKIKVGMKMLIHGRVEGVVADYHTLVLTSEALGVGGQVVIHPYPLHDSLVHFMFNKKTIKPGLIAEVNKAISQHH